jgi:hypothetical protein
VGQDAPKVHRSPAAIHINDIFDIGLLQSFPPIEASNPSWENAPCKSIEDEMVSQFELVIATFPAPHNLSGDVMSMIGRF